MSAASASSRTTKMIWLSPPVSLRVRWAMYTPETAVLGTVHERVTAQLPQSIRPEAGKRWQAGCALEPVGARFCAIMRAPSPP